MAYYGGFLTLNFSENLCGFEGFLLFPDIFKLIVFFKLKYIVTQLMENPTFSNKQDLRQNLNQQVVYFNNFSENRIWFGGYESSILVFLFIYNMYINLKKKCIQLLGFAFGKRS